MPRMTADVKGILTLAYELRLLTRPQVQDCAQRWVASATARSPWELLAAGDFLSPAALDRLRQAWRARKGPEPAEILKRAFQMKFLTRLQLAEAVHRYREGRGQVPIPQILLDAKLLTPPQLERVLAGEGIPLPRPVPDEPAPAVLLRAALDHQMLRPAQTRQALSAFRRAGGRRSLSRILEEQGLLGPADVARLLAYARAAQRPKARIAGETARLKRLKIPPPSWPRRLAIAGAVTLVVAAAITGFWAAGDREAGPTDGPPPPRPGLDGSEDSSAGPAPPARRTVPGFPNPDDDIQWAWNEMVHRFRNDAGLPALEEARRLRDEALAAEAPYAEHLERGVESLETALRERRIALLAEYEARAEALAAGDQFGAAIFEWEWFPVRQWDEDGTLAPRVEEAVQALRRRAQERFDDLRTRYDEAFQADRMADARVAMEAALRIGFPETTSEARRLLSAIHTRLLEGISLAAERELRVLEEASESDRQSRIEAEAVREAWWEKVRQGRLDEAAAFLQDREAASSAPAYREAVALMRRVGEAARSPGEAMERLLADRVPEAYEAAERSGPDGEPIRALLESSPGWAASLSTVLWPLLGERIDASEFEAALRPLGALALVPAEKVRALRRRAGVYAVAENFTAAMVDLQELFELGEVDPETVGLLERVYKRSALVGVALRLFQRGHERDPENPQLFFGLLQLQCQTRRFEEAIRLIDAAPAPALRHPEFGAYNDLVRRLVGSRFKELEHVALEGPYRVESDASLDRAHEVAALANRMYDEYARMFPYPRNEALVFTVKAFSTGFDRYFYELHGQSTVQGTGRIGGFYSPMTKELVLPDDGEIESTLRHEALHQFLDFFLEDAPLWFNEGYGCYFETSTVGEPRLNPQRIQEYAMAPASYREIPLARLMRMPRGEFRGDPNPWALYALSWSAVYFLRTEGHAALLEEYFRSLAAGTGGEEAFDRVFASRIEALDEEWRRWCSERR